MLGHLLLASAAAAIGLVLSVWLLSLRLHDASIIDVFWGLGFVLIAWLCFASGDGAPARAGGDGHALGSAPRRPHRAAHRRPG